MPSKKPSNRRPERARYEVDQTQVDSWMQDSHHHAFRPFVHVVMDTQTGFVCGLKVSRTPLLPTELLQFIGESTVGDSKPPSASTGEPT